MKSRVSAPVASRNHSAIVRAERATRSRAPGGSFIWPKHMTVLSMTDLPVLPILVSCISSQRSLPSRVRSPTPAKTEIPAVDLGDARDQLGQDHRLAQPGPAEKADLAAPDERGQQVDDLDARLELLGLGREAIETRRVAVDRPALCCVNRSPAVDRVAEQVEDATQRFLADRHAHRAAGVDDRHPPNQPVGRSQGHAPNPVAAEVLLDLAGQVDLERPCRRCQSQTRCKCWAGAPRRTRRRTSSRSPGQSVRSWLRWP